VVREWKKEPPISPVIGEEGRGKKNVGKMIELMC